MGGTIGKFLTGTQENDPLQSFAGEELGVGVGAPGKATNNYKNPGWWGPNAPTLPSKVTVPPVGGGIGTGLNPRAPISSNPLAVMQPGPGGTPAPANQVPAGPAAAIPGAASSPGALARGIQMLNGQPDAGLNNFTPSANAKARG